MTEINQSNQPPQNLPNDQRPRGAQRRRPHQRARNEQAALNGATRAVEQADAEVDSIRDQLKAAQDELKALKDKSAEAERVEAINYQTTTRTCASGNAATNFRNFKLIAQNYTATPDQVAEDVDVSRELREKAGDIAEKVRDIEQVESVVDDLRDHEPIRSYGELSTGLMRPCAWLLMILVLLAFAFWRVSVAINDSVTWTVNPGDPDGRDEPYVVREWGTWWRYEFLYLGLAACLCYVLDAITVWMSRQCSRLVTSLCRHFRLGRWVLRRYAGDFTVQVGDASRVARRDLARALVRARRRGEDTIAWCGNTLAVSSFRVPSLE